MRISVPGLMACLLLLPAGAAHAITPNDYVAQQSTLHQIRAVEAWNYTTCSSDVIVAILDSGIDVNHPELAPNLWSQKVNGVPAGVHGYNFRDNNNDITDRLGRGTHVAGIIGAATNNGTGIAGICWNVQLMALKVSKDEMGTGGVLPSVGAAALTYAADNGANVILVDFTTGNDPGLKAAVQYAIGKGAVVVAAAGDNSLDLDKEPLYPAAWQIPGLISVANVDLGAKMALSSNYGAKSVTVAAPGVNAWSTLPGGFVGSITGTAEAAAHVAGAAAMMKSYQPSMTNLEIANAIATLSSTREILSGKVASGALLDLGLLVAQKRDQVDAHIICPTKVKVGQVVSFDGSKSVGPITEYLWEFGDPADELGKVVPYQWNRPGKVSVELKVTTGDGRVATAVQEIEITGGQLIPGVCSVAETGGQASPLAWLLPLLGLLAFRRSFTGRGLSR